MARRPRWWHVLQSSKNEAVLAIDLYNRSGQQRQLEAFIVHMSLAWLRLFQAKVERDGGDLYTRNQKNNRRIRAEDGDWRMKPLDVLTGELLTDTDPRRVSLEFFTGLRNKIEHRYEKDISALVSGKTQAHVLNYERTLVDWFGSSESVAHELRFPIFLSSITDDAVEAVKTVAARVPRSVRQWVYDFDANLDPVLASDQAFDFRILLIPQTGSKTTADTAMTFVRLDELTDEQRAVMDQAQTIIRDKQVPVANLDKYPATEVARDVAKALGHPFTVTDHTACWKHYAVRPKEKTDGYPETTDSRYCVWDRIAKRHLYTAAWIKKLSKELADSKVFTDVCGHPPRPPLFG
ncbi:DUF3644 domain-containing protein [Dermacoccus nishinomiyaensis]|uniref:DUF3644 domain-containing protein n=1 Tax=Dermacoccus nishinomiyaensis TaxID=1274 RepID=UPI0030B92C74